jgi:hypothetical protein
MSCKTLLPVLAMVSLLSGVGTPLRADEASQSVTDHGLTVYYGIVPAAIAQGIAGSHGEASQHGGPPAGEKPSYHLLVAVFNAVTGERVANGTVTASVTKPGLDRPAKPLEPMKIADTVTYGNFFDFPQHGVYRIRVTVIRPEKPQPVVIDLSYDYEGRL